MAKICIGDINKFAIEFEVISKSKNNAYLGYCKIWIGGYFIGNENELMFIKGYLQNELTRIEIAPVIEPQSTHEFSPHKKYRHFKLRLKNLNDASIENYRFNFGPISDEYLLFVYKFDDYLNFVWKHENGTKKSMARRINISKAHCHSIAIEEYSQVVSLFKSIIALDKLI